MVILKEKKIAMRIVCGRHNFDDEYEDKLNYIHSKEDCYSGSPVL